MESLNFWALLWGIGIFMLGMSLMTDGIKSASGPMLVKFLEKSTNTKLKWFFSWFLATAILQSSSTTTLLAIGFVNAWILSFVGSLWLIFGSNVWSTVTVWLIALIGKIDISSFALPMIGIGFFMKAMSKKMLGALGMGIIGLGLIFMGIDQLQVAFHGVENAFDFSVLQNFWPFASILFLLAGLILTVIVQSSAASMAIILTLMASIKLPMTDAMAMIIGANIGTTATAFLASIGATANAKRAAFAHISFNIITWVACFVLLHGFAYVVEWLVMYVNNFSWSEVIDIEMKLTIFHTLFNIFGVILMIPLAPYIAKFLENSFKKWERIMEKPQFLDENLLSIPALAVESLTKEIDRYRDIFITSLHGFITHLQWKSSLLPEVHKLDELGWQINDFINKLAQENMPIEVVEQLTQCLKIRDQYIKDTEYLKSLIDAQSSKRLYNEDIEKELQKYFHLMEVLIQDIDTPEEMKMQTLSDEKLENLNKEYQRMKQLFMDSMIHKKINLKEMEENTRLVRILRRILLDFSKVQKISSQTSQDLQSVV